jgi:hypothetical protein
MRVGRWWVPLALALVIVAVTGVAGASAGLLAQAPAEPAPVASLEPAKTAALWKRLVSMRPRPYRAQTDCRPLRAVFYAATDYLRLATKLAASASPCAEYYISIPPIVGNKTQLRRDAAWRVRALGPNFHAMAEIHFTTWSKWVAETGSSWYQAGVTARERMAAAGYDVTKGDTWAFNEANSAVRRGTGSARTILRDFLRGLYEGDGSSRTKGAVFVIGVGQRSTDLSLYQTNLQNWLTDSGFWAEMATYVSDWSQEVYGDMRYYAVPGLSESVRRDYLNDYLQHKLVLAGVGPPTIEPARSYLREAYSPLANAAWEREAGYGWTMVSTEQMSSYVSSQVHALRFHSTTTGQPRDHWGFAWAPRNASGTSAEDFATRSGLVLDRLGAAIRDSAATVDPNDPGVGACGPAGQNLSCVGDVEGARVNEAWKNFRGWTQAILAFTSQAQTVTAGAPSAVMSLELETSTGLSVTTPAPLAITVRSSSQRGAFSTSAAGPWTSTLALTITAGTGTTGTFYYRDTRAGTPSLTAVAGGVTTGTQTVTVRPGPVNALALRPESATIQARSEQALRLTAADAFGNAVTTTATWSLRPRTLGTIVGNGDGEAVFTAGRQLGTGTVTAIVTTPSGPITATASVRVLPGQLRVDSVRYLSRGSGLLVTVSTVDVAGRPVSGTAVSVVVRRDGRPHYGTRGTTGASGRIVYRVPARHGGCFSLAVRRASAAGFVWDRRTPRNRFCVVARA